MSILLIEIRILCEEIPWLLQPEWVRRSEQRHLWNSDSRGTLLPGGYLLHRQVGNTQNPNWANSLLFLHIPFCCCCCCFSWGMFGLLSVLSQIMWKLRWRLCSRFTRLRMMEMSWLFSLGRLAAISFTDLAFIRHQWENSKNQIIPYTRFLNGFDCFLFHLRRRWRRWCPCCRIRPGLCHGTAWRSTWEFCPCILVFLTPIRWRSLSGCPLLFAR